MGVCRESQNIFTAIKDKNWKRVWYLIKYFNKLTYEDTFMPIVCKFLGHKHSISDFEYEYGDAYYSCERCHKYIEYHPILEGLDETDTKLVKFIEQETKEKVKIEFDNVGIILSWAQFGSDGKNSEEAFKIKALKKTILNYLRWRLREFYYNGNNRQFVYIRFKNDPEKENLIKSEKDKIMSETNPKKIKFKCKET